jgi:hypothetical protein
MRFSCSWCMAVSSSQLFAISERNIQSESAVAVVESCSAIKSISLNGA